ncbi:MAG: prepilin-type N-terminal cleavage/methylation domain-containing protein [Planctomycetes bacterium]|nr:prepilin-type N-terminal cleavage/methylation domain-containing protein [Planctomycetota bacterium]
MLNDGRFRARPASGFTLVELLVVVTIIGLLIGLLIPGLGAAQNYALNLHCQNNLSQIAKAVINYTADYKGSIPPTKYTTSNLYWCNLLVRGNYLSAEDTSKLGANDPSSAKSVLRCPLASDLFVTETDSVPLPATESGEDKAQGTARLGSPTLKADCSYYWNGYIANGGSVDEKARRFPSVAISPTATPADKALLVHDISEIRQRTATVLAADGILFDADSKSNRGRIAARHRGDAGDRTATNIVYYDGHVEQISRDPGEDKQYSTDPIMSATDLDMAGAPLFMLPKR